MQAGAQSLDAFERIDRASSDFDADFLEGETMSCEVNQLLTAIWSPIASVEQDGRPMPGNRSDHVTRVAFVIDALNCWKFRSVLKDEHGREPTARRVFDRNPCASRFRPAPLGL